MKKFLSTAIGLCSILVLLTGCVKDTCRNKYRIFKPVYKTLSEVRAAMKSNAAQPLQRTGKIYVYGNYIFLNEQYKGIHVIDNTNPAAPKNSSFIPIPGNADIAVKGNYLFADSYSDIAVLDISNPSDVRPVQFLNNMIKDKNQYWFSNRNNPDSIEVVAGYTEKDTIMDCDAYTRWVNCRNCSFSQLDARMLAASVPQTGVAGSLARFSVVNDYLYAVSNSQLYSIDVSTPASLQQTAERNIGWNIETIYPFQNKLFIGSRQGMFIFDLTNAANPVQQGQFTHATACDPVIAEEKYAYVTLRSGNSCNGTLNQLDVIDISNLSNPSLKKTYRLSNPYGLSKDKNKLFICDGKDGLKVYNASDVNDLKLISHFKGIEAYDVIALNGKAIVVAKDGLYQYDYSGAYIFLLSKISILN